MIQRAAVAFAHDVIMAGVAFVAALYLRLGDLLWYEDWTRLGLAIGLFVAVAAPVFWFAGLYRGVWRYASMPDMIAIAKAVTLVLLVYLPIMFLVTRLEGFPRSTLVIAWFVLMALLCGPRLLYRLFKDRHAGHVLEQADSSMRRTRVLLVGAGDEADVFIREMARRRDAPYEVIGIIDEKGRRIGRQIRAVRVLGDLDDLPQVVAGLRSRGLAPKRLILTKPRIRPEVMERLLDLADSSGMTLARVPDLAQLQKGGAGSIDVRPVAIEDLLARPQAVLDRPAMRALVEGRRVLVTGAGGSIGGELTRQIAALAPAHLTLVDASEYNLYAIDRDMQEQAPALPRDAALADVRDRGRMAAVFAAARPELVFHAAALKHVPLVEANPGEGALTNVVGTRIVADLCVEHRVDAMVQISTDKAVNPVSVMGATKRLAEAYAQARDIAGAATDGAARRPRFVTVRFGNVLGSSGSVVPLFQRQLEQGGPLTVTHVDAVRYFMTIREAVELVLQASVLGVAEAEAPPGRIFVLDMGAPVRIIDLARRMIQLAGLKPDQDIEIRVTGLRPGERLAEDLFHEMETLGRTPIDGIRLAEPRAADHAFLARAIDELRAAAVRGDLAGCLKLLCQYVPEYRPDAAGAVGGQWAGQS
ncbi:MAG: nucleoside-diphosphate sugar epimerase/dehydratase [Alphaproteobacteria bacterium]